jgi:hypothetical protein
MAGDRRDEVEPATPSPPSAPAHLPEGDHRRPYQGKHRAPAVNPRTLRSGLISRLRDQSSVQPQPTTHAPASPPPDNQPPPACEHNPTDTPG